MSAGFVVRPTRSSGVGAARPRSRRSGVLALLLANLSVGTSVAQTNPAPSDGAPRTDAGPGLDAVEQSPAPEGSDVRQPTESAQDPEPAPTTADIAESSVPAASDDSEARRSEALSAFRQGVAAYEQGDYSRAVVHFLRADSAMPSAAFSFNIARAYDRLGDVANSLEWYRDYLRRAPDASDRDAVLALIEERQIALQEMGLQQLSIFSEPNGASIAIDGKPVGVTPWTGEVVPGAHTLALSHPTFETHTKTVYLPASEALDVVVVLDQLRQPPPRERPAPGPAPVQSSRPTRSTTLWPWITMGAGGAALAAAGGFEIARRSSEADARNASTQVARADAYDEMSGRQSVARVLGIVGGGLLVAGGVWWALDLRSTESSAKPAEGSTARGPQLTGLCTPTGCGLELWGQL